MGIKVSEALDVCNTGAKMLRLAEKIEAGEIEVEGEKMVLSEDFKGKLNTKYDSLKKGISDKIKEMEGK